MKPGPPPKRSKERVRKGDPTVEVRTVNVDELIKHTVEIPVADPDWTPVVRRLYESLAKSAQCVYYEPSDWAYAYLLHEGLDREMTRYALLETTWDPHAEKWEKDFHLQPPRAGALTAYQQGLSQLMVTEKDRREARVEIERTIHVGPGGAEPETPDEVAERRRKRAQGA